MLINADFSQRALVVPSEDDWVSSPAHGVERLLLDRVGDEVARATSIVRYAPESSFERHMHAEGEEFLVLEGTFSDEHGDYSMGTYVRNPPGSGHSPFSTAGCTILVKLRQFDPADLAPVVIDTTDVSAWSESSDLLLHRYASERVMMRRVQIDAELLLGEEEGGVEMFVVEGSLELHDLRLTNNAWLRLPPGDADSLVATTDSTVLLKSGHLAHLL